MYSVIDIETTGGKSASNRITEIAIVKTDGKEIFDTFSTLVNPHRKIDKFVVQLTGITDEMVSSAPSFEDIAEKILEFTQDTIFVAHNIGFDYSIVKREFRKINQVFRRNNLCTVQLSRKILKNEDSYSLGKLSKSLGIELENRHRALGDAEATAHLLHHLINTVGEETVMTYSSNKNQQIEFKGEITNEIIEELPEDTGTYRFLDKNGKVIYIGFAKNIFSTVTKFLIQEAKTTSYHGLMQNMFSIDFEVINSFLVCQLSAISNIMKYKPEFNKLKSFRNFPVGVYERDEDLLKGPFIIEQTKLATQKPLWEFSTTNSARRYVKKMKQSKFLIPPNFKGDAKAFDDLYKDKTELFLKNEVYPERNFFIIREVSFENKAYVVWVENFVYQGFGEVDLAFFDQSIESLKECIVSQKNHQQIQKLLKKYILKAKGIRLVKY